MHITEITGDYGEGQRSIYGSYGTQHYAWHKVLKGGKVGDIEVNALYSADNYAWMVSYNWYKSIYQWKDKGNLRPTIMPTLRTRQDQDPDEDPEATEDPYKSLPNNDEAVPDSSIQPPSSTLPDNLCHDCLITDGGCTAVFECGYAQANQTIDPACQNCTCGSQGLALTDSKCAGFEGKLPDNYKFPPEQTTPPKDPSKDPPKDQPKEETTCYNPGKGSSTSGSCYISRDAMKAHATDFCDKVGAFDTANLDKAYATDTYSGAHLHVSSTARISNDDCLARMTRIIDGCTPAATNPMNWKYGGETHSSSPFNTTFKITIDTGRSCHRRAQPDGSPIQAAIAACDSFYQAVRDEFYIYGAGFLGDGFGTELLNQMSRCIGSTVSDWRFEYFEQPDDKGMEWRAFGHTPIWQKNCFSPVIRGAGGPDVGCNGSG